MIDQEDLKREKEKARKLRKTRWWQIKIANASCYYCGVAIPKDEVTMDHIVPLSQGGLSSKSNVCTCCKECNNKKKNLNIVDWTLSQT